MMLVLAFGRARDALPVMVNLPLALIGGVAGVFLGGVLSVASLIGFITSEITPGARISVPAPPTASRRSTRAIVSGGPVVQRRRAAHRGERERTSRP